MAQMRVLLVDDEEELVSTLGERFSLRGIEADAVMTGVDALDLIQKKDFDVVILDIKMPGMDGLQVLKRFGEGKRKRSKRGRLRLPCQADKDRKSNKEDGRSCKLLTA